jgi:hypothetical protein
MAIRRLLVLSIVVFACAHRPDFQPAPGAARVANQPRAAQASEAGVRVIVNEEPWKGEPGNLPDFVTPLKVTIVNDSDAPVLIRYRDFQLTAEAGLQTNALPPFQIQRPGVETVAVRPFFPSERFFLFGPYAAWYPQYPLWGGPFDYDPAWYDQSYRWQPSLPTPDMLQKALPEGVLQPGGRATGYLYFNRLPGPGRVEFQAHFAEPDTQRRVADVDIPLTYD